MSHRQPFSPSIRQANRRIFSFVGLVLLIAFILGTTGRLWGGHEIYGLKFDLWFGMAAGLFIFCIVAAENSLLEKVLSFLPLRAVGLVSFSVYILHPVVIDIIRQGTLHYFGYMVKGIPMLVLALSFTYIVSCFTYTYIERPFTR